LIGGGAASVVLCLPFTSKVFAHPGSGIVVDRKGQVFFVDNGGGAALWKIDGAGKLRRLREGGWHWLALDERGNYSAEDLKRWFKEGITMNFGRVPLPDSKGALLQADGAPFVIDRDGNLCWAKGNLEIARLSLDGKVTLLAPSMKETASKLGGIKGLACGADGCLYVSFPSAVLKMQPDGKVTTLAHPINLNGVDTDLPKGTPDDQKPFLRGLAVDAHGAVYAAASGSRCVVKIAVDGKVEVVLKAERPWSPTGVAVSGEDVYVLEYTNGNAAPDWLPRIRKLGRDGRVTTLAQPSPLRAGTLP